jgi:hypothetical protein
VTYRNRCDLGQNACFVIGHSSTRGVAHSWLLLPIQHTTVHGHLEGTLCLLSHSALCSCMASSPSRESRRELFEGSVSGAQDRPWIPRLRSDPHLYTAPPHSLVEFRAQEGSKARERHFRELWERLPDTGTHLLDHEPSAPDDTRSEASMPSKEAHKMVQQYEDELMGRCHGSMGPLRRKIRWKEFCSYVEAKETGMRG